MNFVRRAASGAGIISVTLALAACGGGGGSSGTASNNSTATNFSVTSANMQDVGAQAYRATSSMNAQIGGSSSSFVTGVAVDTTTAGVVGVTMQELYRALNTQTASNLVVGSTVSQTVACTDGGTLQVSANFASSSTVTAGDSVTMTASACKESGYTLNGSISVTFKSINGIPGESANWSGAFAVTYTNFSVISGSSADTASISGSLSMNINQTGYGAASYSVSGNSLNLSETHNGSTTSTTLSNFSYNGSLQSGIITYSSNFGVSGNLGKLGNASFTVKTLTDFKQPVNGQPTQGALKITASDNSSVTLTVLDSTNVKLDLDKNGDGVIDESVTTTWTALQSRL